MNKTRQQNIGILVIIFSFLALTFAVMPESAQTKKGVKPTPTPTKKKTTSTPAKTAKATPKPSPAKTSAKTTATPLPKEAQQIIVSVAAARLRSQAGTDSAELRRVKLGTVLKVSEKKNDWFKVQVPGSPKPVTGWMANQVVMDYDAAKRDEIYTRMVEKNYKTNGMSFGDAAEVYEFLTKAQNEVKTPKLSEDFGFKRLLALRAALKAIPFNKQNQKIYKDFLKLHEKDVVYSDPAGEWFVRSELFWKLHKKYSNVSDAEDIAWAATQNPLPGECEGYINCYLFMLRETDGEYLNLYPNGKHAAQSLKNIKDLLDPIAADLAEKKIYTGPSDVSDRAEFNRLLAELRTIISKLPFSEAEKQKAIQQINQIAEGYR